MAKLDTLLSYVSDPQLRAELKDEIYEMRRSKDFGLVFESHLPESIRLPQHPVRRGVKVSRRDATDKSMWLVDRVRSEVATLVPLLDTDGIAIGNTAETLEVEESALVVVADFGDTIYPGLRQIGSVDRGDDKAAHVVINGENYHALNALMFTHMGKIDCIYIDPPYNTGDKDWKYNNDYVDLNDRFRHSKWLSFIQRRLRLAGKLLSPNGTLVITIDHREVSNLGVLLAQTYPKARIQLVTIVTNPSGRDTSKQFAWAGEYAFFCRFGSAAPVRMSTDLLTSRKQGSIWDTFHRSGGANDHPTKRPNLVYPISVDPDTLTVTKIGPTLDDRINAGEMSKEDLAEWTPNLHHDTGGNPVVWPFNNEDELCVWQYMPKNLQKLIDDGFFKVTPPRYKTLRPFTLGYVKKRNQNKILEGEYETTGREASGTRIIQVTKQDKTAKSIWKVPAHDANKNGKPMLKNLIGNTDFLYPKSPYAVADTLQSIVGNNPDAIILDFFAGSGTTLQSAAMLNAEDNGRRQVLLVTNNEVGEQTDKALRKRGLRPGDPEYEAEGIFASVTRPRIQAAIEGKFRGKQIKGKYKAGYADERALAEGFEENVKFFELTYQDVDRVEYDMAFNAIAPLLWMRAGSEGEIIGESLYSTGGRKPYASTDRYAILFNTDHWQSFILNLPPTAETVFVVTDSPTMFTSIVAELPSHVQDRVRLYERYLTTFAVNQH